MLKVKSSFVASLLVLLLIAKNAQSRRKQAYPTEAERQAEYIRRGHTWPPAIYPDTPGWNQILTQRLSQAGALEDLKMKWNVLISTLTSTMLRNFTEFGWGLTRAPEELTEELREAIYGGLDTARPEGQSEPIDGPIPKFIDREDLTEKALYHLQPILESWSQTPLEPSVAYGFRLYQNQSRLWMHTDRTQTHVISCVYHIASSEDAKPWPIVIEDYAGKTNAVILHPGDILMYESAKNFHGRPTRFDGSWYTSLFLHFQPRTMEWVRHNHDLDSHYAIPPNWVEHVPSDEPKILAAGTSIRMPDCSDSWCPLSEADHYEGPGIYGIVKTGGGEMYYLDIDDE